MPHKAPENEVDYLTVLETAKMVDRSPNRVRQYFREGRLPYVQTPYGRVVPREAAERLRNELARSRRSQAERAAYHTERGRVVTDRREPRP